MHTIHNKKAHKGKEIAERAWDRMTNHVIERDGKSYILEWNIRQGRVSITETMTCSCGENCPHDDPLDCDCEGHCPECDTLEAYDYEAVDGPP